ncbi:MAG: PH domain-containing protein [Burkholderiaceae bacterium]
MTVFPSKIDTWIATLVGTSVVAPIALGLYLLSTSTSAGLTAMGAGAFTAVVVALIAVPCRYELLGDHLLIRSGMIRQRIFYRDIDRIEPSSNPFSAPALSMQRVLITYTGGFQLVSPHQREQFMRLLRQRVDAARAAAPQPSSRANAE